MWNWLNCYLSGRHDFGVACSSGSIYLQCNYCGKRSGGWTVHEQQQQAIMAAPSLVPNQRPKPAKVAAAMPFRPRRVARQQQSA
jgi:hypothetical protein